MQSKIVFIGLTLFISLNLSSQHWSDFLRQGKSLPEIDQDIVHHIKNKSASDQKQILKHYKRWRIFANYNYRQNAEEANQINSNKWKIAEELKPELNNYARNNFGTWQNITPDTLFYQDWPNYGVVQDIEFDKDDPNTMYAGTHGAGLLRRNADGSWEDLTFGMPVQGVTGIAADSNRITFITGSKAWWAYFRFQGVFYSNDFGKTWKVHNFFTDDLPWSMNTYGLRVHPTNFNIQYALTSVGVFVTFNGWETSTKRTANPAYDLIFDPVDPNIVYLNMEGEVYKCNTSLSNNELIFSDPEADKVLLAKSNIFPFSLYLASCTNALGRVNFYKSDDSGQTNIYRGQVFKGQLGWNWCFGIHPANNDRLFLGTIDFIRSENGGLTWANAGGLGLHADQHDLAWKGNQLYLANDGGISFSSSYVTDSWDASISIGMKNIHITHFDVHNNKIIGGFFHAGSQTWNIGENKSLIVGGGDGFECFYDLGNPNDYYTTTQGPGFFKNSMVPVQDPNGISSWGQPFIPDPGNNNYLYLGQQRLYRYNKLTSNFQDLNVRPDTIRVDAIGVCKNQSTIGYASLNEFGPPQFVRFSVGNATLNLTAALPPEVTSGNTIREIIVDENDYTKIWICLNKYDQDNIFYSSNGGLTWTYIGGPELPKAPIFSMVRIPTNNQIYLGTEYGIYYKDDTMSEWIRFSNGLGYQRVVDLDIDNGYLYASLWGSGIWRTPLRSGCPPNRFLIAGVYPNPYLPGFVRFEAFQDIITDLEIVTNEGTDVEISGDRKVVLLPGFRASSISDDNFDYITTPKIQIKSEGCQN